MPRCLLRLARVRKKIYKWFIDSPLKTTTDLCRNRCWIENVYLLSLSQSLYPFIEIFMLFFFLSSSSPPLFFLLLQWIQQLQMTWKFEFCYDFLRKRCIFIGERRFLYLQTTNEQFLINNSKIIFISFFFFSSVFAIDEDCSIVLIRFLVNWRLFGDFDTTIVHINYNILIQLCIRSITIENYYLWTIWSRLANYWIATDLYLIWSGQIFHLCKTVRENLITSSNKKKRTASSNLIKLVRQHFEKLGGLHSYYWAALFSLSHSLNILSWTL